VKGPFETAFSAVWTGLTESDGFNRLVLELGVDWREAALVRTLARYRQQTGLDPSQAVQEEALRDYPAVAPRPSWNCSRPNSTLTKGGDGASREARSPRWSPASTTCCRT
jgi:glutamate dehydrogenase